MVVGASACTAGSEPVGTRPSFYISPEQPGDPDECSPNGCGTNSPVVDGVAFSSLHTHGLPNLQHIAITNVWCPLYPAVNNMKIRVVDNDRLQAFDPITGAHCDSVGLAGTKIYLSTPNGPTHIWITDVSTDSFWVTPTAAIERYEFRYQPMEDPDPSHYGKPVCSNGDGIDETVYALAFAGDRYYEETKIIEIGNTTRNWITIACESSATYKMHKSGYTTAAGNRLGIETSLDDRRSLLNAWTANVCGGGEAFTHEGEKITLQGTKITWPTGSDYLKKPDTIEAIWGPRGAICLDTPRLSEEDPLLLQAIAKSQGCDGELPPPCSNDQVARWWRHGYVITGNPHGE